MESEVLPVWRKIRDYDMKEKDYKLLIDNIKNNMAKYDKLALSIFEKYLPGFLKIPINK
jgi:hypothetical protein